MERHEQEPGAAGQRGDVARSRARLTAPAAVALLLALPFLLLRSFIDIDPYDEGIRLYGAMRVLDGAVPYRDFFACYGPAQFYWPAAWLALFGEQLWVARLSELVGMGGGVVAMTLLLRRACAGWQAILWTLAAVLLPLSVVQLGTFDPSLSLVLAAGAAAGTGTPPSARRLVAAGLLLGAASLFRQDFAFYGAVATAAMLAACARTDGGVASQHGPSWAACWPVMLRRTLVVAAASCAVALPVYGWLASTGPLVVWDSIVSKPAELIALRRLPYLYALHQLPAALREPSLAQTLRAGILLTPVLAGGGLAALALPRIRAELFAEPGRRAVLVFLAALAAGLCVYALARTDVAHMYPMQIVVCAVLALGSEALLAASVAAPARAALRRISSVAVALCLAVGLGDRALAVERREPARLERAELIRIRRGERWIPEAVRDAERYAENAPVYLGSEQHDRVIANLLTAYFLLGRAAPTYYHDVQPGLTTTAAVQSRMVEELEASGVRAALLWKHRDYLEPNRGTTERGATLLDEYLARHFQLRVDNARYRVLVRNQ